MIGFLQEYTVTEGMDSMIEVEIELLSGHLGTSVMVWVFTRDGFAKGELLQLLMELFQCEELLQ